MYGELYPDLQTELSVVPPTTELEAELQRLLCFDAETFRSHIERLSPSEYVEVQPRCQSHSCAGLPRLIPWSQRILRHQDEE